MEGKGEAVSVVIPAYNEEGSVGEVIAQVERVLTQAQVPHEVIVVDDASKDGTASEARHSGARVLRHVRNRGYGAALKTGINAARHELIVITDADGTYPVGRIPEMLSELRTADMVVGARVGPNVAVRLAHRPAKWVLRRFAEYVTGQKVPDLNSGLRAFRRQLAQQYLNILPDRFSFTATITVAALCDNYRVVFLPIDYYQRVGDSKFVPWNTFEIVAFIMRLSVLFNPFKVFVPIALVCILLAIAKLSMDFVLALREAGGLTLYLVSHQVISASSIILFLAGLQILLIAMLADGLGRKVAEGSVRKQESFAVDVVEASSRGGADAVADDRATAAKEEPRD